MGADPSFELEMDLDFLPLWKSISTLSNERGARTSSDSDWLEINGNPTIPHVQSIRAPPAPIALHATKDSMLGITNKNASRRYLEKLQRDRERNQEVLAECIDNLPITIKQLVYPEKPTSKEPWRFGTASSNHSRETKFRVGRTNDYWQETGDQWLQENSNSNSIDHESVSKKHRPNGRKVLRKSSHHSGSTSDDHFLQKDFVHYPGFQGSQGQSQSLKYKFGKKKSSLNSENAAKPPPAKFRPRGYGSLYDELEFERRYKKVFDLNKHIHFVHSNFLSGQRLIKRTKLPPIGHIPSIQSDPMDTGDIFAIMSVQKYNHPNDSEKTRLTLSNPGSGIRRSDGFPTNRIRLEVSQSLDTPVGFVPGTIPKTGSSPFDGIYGSNNEITRENLYRLQSLLIEHTDTKKTLNIAETDNNQLDSRKHQDSKRKQEDEKRKVTARKQPWKPETAHSVDFGSEAPDDNEPFNIRVHVEIKPHKEDEITEEHSGESHPGTPRQGSKSTEEEDFKNNKERPADEQAEAYDALEEKVVFPTKLNALVDDMHVTNEGETQSETYIKPRNISVTTNEYGFITKKVQYPQEFVIENSIPEIHNRNKTGDSMKDEALDNAQANVTDKVLSE